MTRLGRQARPTPLGRLAAKPVWVGLARPAWAKPVKKKYLFCLIINIIFFLSHESYIHVL